MPRKPRNTLPPIVHVHRPVLTEEERARRMKLIEEAAVNLIIETERAIAKKQGRPSEF